MADDTNLGKYAEGQLVGETLKFPTTTEEVQSLLKRIGVDGVRYEEIFITSFDSDVLGLHEHLGEYENIDELNYLAALLSEMDQSDLEKFEAVIDAGEYTGSVKDLITLTQNLDCFEFYSGIHSEEDLGRMLCCSLVNWLWLLYMCWHLYQFSNTPNEPAKKLVSLICSDLLTMYFGTTCPKVL